MHQNRLTIWEEVGLAWEMYKDHYKPFILVFLISVSFPTFTIFLGLAVNALVLIAQPPAYTYLVLMVTVTVLIGLIFIFTAFQACQYGLSYEIIASGDLFTEFRTALGYFKRYWWKYALVAALVTLPSLFFNSLQQTTFEGKIASLLVELMAQTLFITTFPALTVRGSLTQAIKENFVVLRKRWVDVGIICLLFYLAFRLPLSIIESLFLIFSIDFDLSDPLVLFLGFIYVTILVITGIVGQGVRSLVLTKIYLEERP